MRHCFGGVRYYSYSQGDDPCEHDANLPLKQHIPPFGDGIAESVPVVGRQTALHTCHGKDELTPESQFFKANERTVEQLFHLQKNVDH